MESNKTVEEKVCFKCGDIRHIQSVCNTTVHLAATNIKSCNSDSMKLSIYTDHLSLSTISKDSVESYRSSELNETQNSCEKTVSNQSTYRISNVIVPDMVFSNDSLISDEIPCKSEENMLNEPSHDRKRDVVLIDADFSNDPLLCNDILNKFEETILEESKLDIIPNIICPHNAFVLRLNQKALGCSTTGQIINLMSVDAQCFDNVSESTSILSLIFYKTSGQVYCTLRVACDYLGININFNFRFKAADVTDQRIRILSDIIAVILSMPQAIEQMNIAHVVDKRISSHDALMPSVIYHYFGSYVSHQDDQVLYYGPRYFTSWSLSSSLSSLNGNDHYPEVNNSNERVVELTNVCSQWQNNLKQITLNSINFKACGRELIGIIGSVGSGKSSLLQTILGELPFSSGNIYRSPSVAYLPQAAWIFPGTIRQNILCNLPFESDRYAFVLKATSLDVDLLRFPEGDKTYVGERGSGLSGGQKARIALARTAYSRQEVLLLDDPLAAVDARVSNHLFQKCICGFLSDRLRFLVTHQHQLLPYMDRILILKESSIRTITTAGSHESMQTVKSSVFDIYVVGEAERNNKTIDDGNIPEHNLSKEPIPGENLRHGKVGWKYYLVFGRITGSFCYLIITLLMFVFTTVVYATFDLWIARWIRIVDNRNETNSPRANDSSHVIGTWSWDDNYQMTCVAERLHELMVKACLSTRILFFESNLSGRILNRFSKDIGIIDDLLPTNIFEFLQCLSLVVTFCAVTVISSYWAIFPAIILSILFWVIRGRYMYLSRDLRRLEAIARTPVLSWINITLQGLPCIRASGDQSFHLNKFYDVVNSHTDVFYMNLAAALWFGIRLDLLCVIFITCVSAICLILGIYSEIPGANVGLMFTYSSSLIGLFQWCVRQSTEVENQMVSVERAIEYVELEPETTDAQETLQPDSDWPSRGHIQFKDFGLRYASSDTWALKNINLDIRPGCKFEFEVYFIEKRFSGVGSSFIISITSQFLTSYLPPDDGSLGLQVLLSTPYLSNYNTVFSSL
ncbi:unnamed protein product [Schistosoma margrebowiei]|uniref:Uncharacterized protein n=1 Tax=Schistosoma margrebowiei TaxID=48269 RepID=A0A183MM24_9TREM|nr:unnamed protein product [Schistosoma margrebowiei]